MATKAQKGILLSNPSHNKIAIATMEIDPKKSCLLPSRCILIFFNFFIFCPIGRIKFLVVCKGSLFLFIQQIFRLNLLGMSFFSRNFEIQSQLYSFKIWKISYICMCILIILFWMVSQK